MPLSPTLLDATLAAQAEPLVAYVRQRLGPGVAEDVVQDALLKAVEAAPPMDGEADLTRWLWRVVRNATVDAHRRREAAGRRETAWADEQPDAVMPTEEAPRLCACYQPLLNDLAPEAAEVLRADLDGEPAAEVADRLGVSAGTLRVRRHRARAALRERLEDVCRACAGCLDCTCAALPNPPVSLSPTPMHTDNPNTDDALTFNIKGMTCGGCVAGATRALDRTPGVTVERLTLDGPAVVRLSGGADREAVRAAVEGAGFRPVFDAA
ncbi:MAG: sigma-70 family RNA polymerase sigma factor [Bacteroidota bacterium]